MKVEEFLEAYGDRNITATHRVSFEITKDRYLTRRGDCIIGIRASKSALDLSEEFKALARREGSVIRVELEVEGVKELASGLGSPGLAFTHPRDMVFRRSRYTCGRTVMVSSDKASIDLSRRMVEMLRDPRRRMQILISVEARSP
ncbi:MAG: DUF371 domain-containing protein [Candidatus Bathyarchaeia archaeon]